MKQLNFDIPTPFVSEPKPERRRFPQRQKEVNTANQDSQLDLLEDAPRRPEPPQPNTYQDRRINPTSRTRNADKTFLKRQKRF